MKYISKTFGLFIYNNNKWYHREIGELYEKTKKTKYNIVSDFLILPLNNGLFISFGKDH